jgi:hypothetical protein
MSEITVTLPIEEYDRLRGIEKVAVEMNLKYNLLREAWRIINEGRDATGYLAGHNHRLEITNREYQLIKIK